MPPSTLSREVGREAPRSPLGWLHPWVGPGGVLSWFLPILLSPTSNLLLVLEQPASLLRDGAT